MFSNDQNIETIAQLAEEVKRYAALKGEYIRLSLVEKTVRILTVILMTIILTVLFLLTLIYFSFSLAYALSSYVGLPGGFAIVGGINLILLILCILFRNKVIVKPLVKFFASILME